MNARMYVRMWSALRALPARAAEASIAFWRSAAVGFSCRWTAPLCTSHIHVAVAWHAGAALRGFHAANSTVRPHHLRSRHQLSGAGVLLSGEPIRRTWPAAGIAASGVAAAAAIRRESQSLRCHALPDGKSMDRAGLVAERFLWAEVSHAAHGDARDARSAPDTLWMRIAS
jgi:hypothetical protein